LIHKILIQIYLVLLILTASTAYGENRHAGEVLAEINLARTAPQAYAGYLREFRRRFQGKNFRLSGSHILVMTTEGVKAVDEAIRVLSRLKPLPPLSWSDGLAAAATELADEQAATGDSGHDGKQSGGMRRRIERHGEWRGEIAENIGYGPAEARLMVLQLIIDDGVPDRGHRKNIFRRFFAKAGVACGPHPTFGQMCVIDFAGGFKEN
jgi:uncharacterized protein YkwD